MRFWMHGIGNDIPASVQLLKTLGFEAVVGNDPAMIRQANDAALDVYLCSGAFTAAARFAGEQFLARDINGKPQLWFNSTCPNQPAVRQSNLEAIAQMAHTSGIKGILIDGARFASPASSADPDAFFTCFCPTCEKKAADLGFDFDSIKNAVRNLYQAMHGNAAALQLADAPGILDWFSFRRQCITEHLLNFNQVVKGVNPELLTGIYIFTPSLSALVGQSYQDLSGAIDIFAPMLYRHYTAKEGPACLNHELSALVRLLAKHLYSSPAAISIIAALCQLPLDGFGSAGDLLDGLPPSVIGSEIRRVKSLLSTGVNQVIPIIQLDDDQLLQSVSGAVQAGADAINFFHYQEEWMMKAQPIFEQLRLGG